MMAYTPCYARRLGKINDTMYPYSLPIAAPRTKVGVNTPQGMGLEIAIIVKKNFKIIYTFRFRKGEGDFQSSCSLI
jgi:hypothetical protein